MMKKLLHVGCGPKRKDKTTQAFNTDAWQEVRFDIDASVDPDVIGTMTDMSALASGSMDALFSSHNIEHLYPHEVIVALDEFRRVVNKTGFVVITCPDIQAVAAMVAEDKLLDVAYQSAAGPITPLDMMYGHMAAMAQGNLYMAHRTGFTAKVLTGFLQAAGFAKVVVKRRPQAFDLWALATDESMPDDAVLDLANAHFPA